MGSFERFWLKAYGDWATKDLALREAYVRQQESLSAQLTQLAAKAVKTACVPSCAPCEPVYEGSAICSIEPVARRRKRHGRPVLRIVGEKGILCMDQQGRRWIEPFNARKGQGEAARLGICAPTRGQMQIINSMQGR
jgi:hypothetical protein